MKAAIHFGSRKSCLHALSKRQNSIGIAALLPIASMLWLICLVVPAQPALAQSSNPPIVVLFPEKDLYHQAADSLVEAQRKKGRDIELFALPESDATAQARAISAVRGKRPRLIVTGGSTLTAEVLREIVDVPVAFFMVPNAADAPFLQDGSTERKRVAGVTSDVSPAQQTEWALHADGRIKSLAVFCSPRSRMTVDKLASASRAHGVTIQSIETRADTIAEATNQATRSGVDGVLMIPDATIYNGASIQHLLVWGIREKRAVFAFSDKIVKAGALAGILTNPADVGKKTSDVVDQIIAGKSPGDIGIVYCEQVSRAINSHTARMISAPIDEARRDKDIQILGDAP